MQPAPADAAAAPRNSRPTPALRPGATPVWPLRRLVRRVAERVRSLDLSDLRHLTGYGIACSGFAVLVAGLIDPSAA